MVNKFNFKQPKSLVAVVGKSQEEIVFSFSELRPYSFGVVYSHGKI